MVNLISFAGNLGRTPSEAVLQALLDGKGFRGKDGVLTPLIKQLSEPVSSRELLREGQPSKYILDIAWIRQKTVLPD